MGLEAKCRARSGGEGGEGKARLETGELTFRGALKADVKLSSIEEAKVDGDDLVLAYGGRSLRLTLGKDASKWLQKIENPKSRIEKLGVKPGHRVLILHVGDDDFIAELRSTVEDVAVGSRRKDNDAVFFGAETKAELDRFDVAKAAIKQEGAVWLVRRKGSKAVTEADGMARGKRAGLVDVKVVAFSPTHTAEKFVIPVAARKPR